MLYIYIYILYIYIYIYIYIIFIGYYMPPREVSYILLELRGHEGPEGKCS